MLTTGFIVLGMLVGNISPVHARVVSAGVESIIPLGSVKQPTRYASRTNMNVPTLHYRSGNIAFSALGVTWQGASMHAEIELRYRDSSGWSSWLPLQAHDSASIGRGGTGLIWTPSATGVEVLVASEKEETLRDVRVHLFNGEKQKQKSAPEQSSEPAPRPTLEYYSRAQWGADESLMNWTPRHIPAVRGITVHHTVTRNTYTREEVPAMMRSIYRFHAVSRGWGDIGYHLVVDRFGRAWEGRAGGLGDLIEGGHAHGFNAATAGVSVLGTFTQEEPTPETRETLARFAAYKLSVSGVHPRSTVQLSGGSGVTINTSAIFGHNTVNNTACPGDGLEKHLDGIRARAGEIYDIGGIDLRLAGQGSV